MLRPTMPAMMKTRQVTRNRSAGSPKATMPMITVPAAPIPVHRAYAVPKGTDFNAIASRPKLSAIAAIMATLGQNLVRPSEYLRPRAQAISSNPASRRASHPPSVLAACIIGWADLC